MSESQFYQPSDIDQLRMENELLTLQAQVLRAELRSARANVAQEDSSSSSVPQGHVVIREEDLRRLQEAHRKLRYVLRRLDGGAIGLVARRVSGFRILKRDWLE